MENFNRFSLHLIPVYLYKIFILFIAELSCLSSSHPHNVLWVDRTHIYL